MENFRQFRGRQRITFSTDSDKNVTLIYGSNGAGKTALLNAFTWGLYGKTTPALEAPDNLINEAAWAAAKPGQSVTARVEVEFEDDGKTYQIERVRTARKLDNGQSVITQQDVATLHVIDAGGEDELANPEGAINQILPDRLHRFFFFDGERDVERLVKPDAFAAIEDSIKTILGLEIIERAISDLGIARKELNKELSAVGTAEDKAVTERIRNLEEQIETEKAELATIKSNLGHLEEELADVNDALAKTEAVRELQERRQEFEEALSGCSVRIANAEAALAREVDRNGFLAFVNPLASQTLEMFDDRRARGEIPSDIKLQFVQDLLEQHRCICGTELVEGSSEHACVESWLARAGDASVDESWVRVAAQAKHLFQRRDDLYAYLHETASELADAQREHRRYEEKLSEIDESILETDSDEGRQLEERRNRLKDQIDDEKRKRWSRENSIEAHEKELTEAERDLEKAEEQNEKAYVARRRVTVARAAEELFQRILDLRTEEVRIELDSRIKEVYERISYKPYAPSLTVDFRLRLSKTVGGEELSVAKSTGESQILSFSFVGAIAERARVRYEETRDDGQSAGGLLSFQGGIFPIVLDAAFGTLDARYQTQVAKALPKLAAQVIVLVSKEQGFNAIRDELWPVAGKHAVIVAHTNKSGAEETIELPHGTKPYILVDDVEDDWSEVKEDES